MGFDFGEQARDELLGDNDAKDLLKPSFRTPYPKLAYAAT